MNSEPVWQSADMKQFSPLKANSLQFDVVIIGGGITGVTAAYLLKKAGKKVCLLERRRIGGGDTGLTTAHLTFVTDTRLPRLVKTFGEEAAAAVWHGGAIAIDRIESTAEELQIDCDFRRVPGFLHASIQSPKDQSDRLEVDAEQAQKLGFPARFTSAPYIDQPAVQFSNQAKFHPLKYLNGVAQAIHGDGSAVYEMSEVSEVQDKPQRVVANGFEIQTEYIVIATHVPRMGKTGPISAAWFQSKIFPYSSYVIGAKVPKNLLPEASFWDTCDPYYYLRVERGEQSDYVIFGGEDHKTGQVEDTEKRFRGLAETLCQLMPEAKPDRQWSGQVIETNDGLPYIGETAERQFAATGFSGNGMTFGTLAGLMARDAVMGTDNPWKELFAFDRTKLRGGTWSYLSENVDYPFYFVKDRLAGVEGTSTDDVPRGEGKIIELDGQRVACSRDDDGKLSTVSAVCTHLGCLVRWNSAEHTWDCPCHGSRFKPNGNVLAGPAESPLENLPIASHPKEANAG